MARQRTLSLRRRVSARLGGVALSVALFLAKLLPVSASDRLGCWLGRVGFRLNKKHRTRTILNLTMCFPDWDESRVLKTAKRVFEHFGRTVMRFFSSVKLTDDQLAKTIEHYDDTPLRTALESNKGVILVCGHFGNWERGAQMLTQRGLSLAVIARNANDEKTTNLINQKRKSHGLEVLARGNAARDVLRALRENKVVAILPDQNARDLFVPFFGFPAGTVSGPAAFHLRTGAPVVFSALWEREDGRYEGFCKQLQFQGLDGNREHDEREIMAQINAELEESIRHHPHQWLWMHDRWKAAREQGLIHG
ncbi:MAG: lysophospholipid acyltransferase family protein [Fimbriimonadales bacterium]